MATTGNVSDTSSLNTNESTTAPPVAKPVTRRKRIAKEGEIVATTEPIDVPAADKPRRISRPPAPLPTKVIKTIDSLKTRNEKLGEENKRLKAQIQEHKVAHSRIRRIPKVASEVPPTAA